jgi:CPA1 family monovalent cation:H+ antiporter
VTPPEIVAALVTLAALSGYLSTRFAQLPNAIGVTLGGLLLSLVLLASTPLGFGGQRWAEVLLAAVPLNRLLLEGFLGVFVFAGALHVDVREFLHQKWPILVLATLGTLLSTLLIGTLVYLMAGVVGVRLPYHFALLFGALISPTDPVAVLSLLRRAGVPKQLEALITGESLFNDGIGVVLFTVLYGVALGGGRVSVPEVATTFLREAVGGVAFGAVLGLAGIAILRSVDDFVVEIMITLAIVLGGYTVALRLHTSGPLALVIAGIVIGNTGRAHAMSERTWQHLAAFWLVLNETLNSILFVMIGLEVLALQLTTRWVTAGALAVVLGLAARWISVAVPLRLLRRRWSYGPHAVSILTWGGLRGGIAIALALSVPDAPVKPLLLVMTYVVVVFSILVQGLTLGPLARRANPAANSAARVAVPGG